MEDKKENKLGLAKKVFAQSNESISNNLDNIRFDKFRNKLRQRLTTDWKQAGGHLTQIEYESGYISDLERIIFDLLNRPGKGGVYNG